MDNAIYLRESGSIPRNNWWVHIDVKVVCGNRFGDLKFPLVKLLYVQCVLTLAHNRLADFQAIAATGINTVRIPVGKKRLIRSWDLGYWSFFLSPGDPYIQGFAQYLDQGITWAQQTGLKVWIDLHGAPGPLQYFSTDSQDLKMDSITQAEKDPLNGEQVKQLIIPNRHSKPLWGSTLQYLMLER
jgi:hypothetical protein